MSFRRNLSIAIVCVFAANFILVSVDASSIATVVDSILPKNPLTLSEALAYADKPNHSVRHRELDVETARINRDYFDSGAGLRLNATITPQSVDRASSEGSQFSNDSNLNLELIYPIYDFGFSQASKDLAQTRLSQAERALAHQHRLRRLEIMQKFFTVLLADLDYAVKNEKMTLAFLRYNRHLEEMEMYEAHAEVDVLALETTYRERFHVREEASLDQISSRRDLGRALGLFNTIPRDLVDPDVSSYVERPIPEFEELLNEVTRSDYAVLFAKSKIQAAVDARKVEEKRYAPKLEAVIEANAWEIKTGSRNSSSVGFQLKIPLIAGKSKSRALKLSEKNIERVQLELDAIRDQYEAQVFTLWKKLKLLEVELTAAQVRSNFRDQYMDRSRALYELEEQSDLGDAQAELLFSLYELKRIEYEIALAWAEIDVMKGLNAGIEFDAIPQ